MFTFNKKDIKLLTGMGQVYTKSVDSEKQPQQPSPPSKEEIPSIREERLKFYNDIKTFQTNVSNQLKAKEISPDTSEELNKIVKEAEEWLRKNSNANLLQVVTQKDDITAKATPIYERELSKNRYNLVLVYADSVQDSYKNNPELKKYYNSQYKPADIKSLSELLKSEYKWLSEHPSETGLVYVQRIDSASQAAQKILVAYPEATKGIESTVENLKQAATPTWWLTKDAIARANANFEQKSKTEFNYERLAKDSTTIALEIFGSFLILILIIFAASLASNMAICRDWPYRVYFFIVSINPLLTPIILAYTALQSLKGNPVEYYALCPISTEPAKTRLGKILWWPFYYESDQNELKLTELFVAAIEATGEAVKGASKPPAFKG
jgi:hypothetical protein